VAIELPHTPRLALGATIPLFDIICSGFLQPPFHFNFHSLTDVTL